MARKNDQNGTQFDTGFGSSNGTFGGSAGGAAKSQAAQGPGGEFSSGFGGGTNVSQIFRDGSMDAEEKRRKIMSGIFVGVALVAVVGAVYYFVFSDSIDSAAPPEIATPAPEPQVQPTAVVDKAPPAESLASVDETDGMSEDEEGVEDEEELVSTAPPTAAGSYSYNEIGGGPIVAAAAGTSIEVSRTQDFSVMYMTGTSNAAGQLRIPNPPPGKVYWRVSGKPEVSEITVVAPPKLGIGMQVGGSLAATDTLQWNAGGDAAHFRLEFATDPKFQSIAYSFSTNKKQLALNGVTPGNYFVRVGGLNITSGRWEFTSGSAVEVK